jgi:hypothetical protein
MTTFSFANPGFENNATPVNDSVHSTTFFLRSVSMFKEVVSIALASIGTKKDGIGRFSFRNRY